jgi:hypothetical protein
VSSRASFRKNLLIVDASCSAVNFPTSQHSASEPFPHNRSIVS